MKKIIMLIITVVSIFSLFGCAEEKYPPVPSTEEEARVIMTFTIGEEKYDVKYELYRALFLNNKSRVDGGDPSVWSSSDAENYINEVNSVITERLCEIFSVIHLAKEIGFDPYSDEIDLKIEEYVKGAVEGDGNQTGHGSYDAYLASLKDNNLNYSTAVFMLRYALAEEAIDKYYLGEYDEILGQQDGEFEYTEKEVKEYYNSTECVRILQSFFQPGIKSSAEMWEYREKLLLFEDEMSLAAYIIGSTTATESDLISDGEISGIIIGKNELIGSEYSAYTDKIFSLDSGEFSDVILLKNTNADGYYIAYALEKTDSHFEKFYTQIRNSYIDNVVGKVLKNISSVMADNTVFTDEYKSVDHSAVSMN